MSDNLQSKDKNIEAHVQAYEGMLALFKWGMFGVATVLIGMAIFLVPRG